MGKILAAVSAEQDDQDDILYYLKLEAFWILTNLSVSDNIQNLLIFVGEGSENIMNDINYSLSEPIVVLIDRNIQALIDNGATDMKTFS